MSDNDKQQKSTAWGDGKIGERKQPFACGGEKAEQDSLGEQIAKCLYKKKPCTCPIGSCTCPVGSCTCPAGSCACPAGTCPQTIELVQNPSFEVPCVPPPPCNVFEAWTGTNIVSSNEALTGTVAAELGDRNGEAATLEQTICGMNPGCPYEFSFSVNTQNQSNTAQFTAQVFWQDGFAPVEAFDPIVMNGSSSGNTYVFIRRITNLAPAGTTCARILFTKTGTGSVLVDDVSFRG